MAVTRLHYPATADVVYATRPTYITIEESTTPLPFNYRTILEIFIGTSTAVAKLKVVPNGNNVAVFRVDKVIQGSVEAQEYNSNDTTQLVHELGTESSSKYFSRGGGGGGAQCRTIKYKIGYESSTAADTQPTETINATEYSFQVIAGSGSYSDNPWWQGAEYSENNMSSTFFGNTSSSKVLTDSFGLAQTTNFHGKPVVFMGYQSRTTSWGVLAFYADGTTNSVLTTHGSWCFTNGKEAYTNRVTKSLSGNGGVLPTTVTADSSRVQYAMIGYKNLVGSDLIITDTDKKYLDFCFASDGSQDPFSNDAYRESVIYRWEMLDCDKFKNPVCLGWENSFGGWDYATFILRPEEGLAQVAKKTITTANIDYTAISSSVAPSYLGNAGRKQTVSYNATRQMTVHSLPQTGDRAVMFESLVASPQVVQIFESGRVAPVTLSDTNFVRRLAVNEMKPVQYEFTFTYDRPMKRRR